MYGRHRFFISFLALNLLAAGFARADAPAPIRHLVYDFDVKFTTSATVHSSGFNGDGPASGVADYRLGSDDKGTITVDVLQVQPDSGLVVRIAENARGTRSNDPKMCVVYGTGSTICDQSHGELNEEEMTLLRLLGKNFVSGAPVDAKHHWQYSSSAPQATETTDYTINKTDGNMLDITYDRQLKVGGAQPFDANSQGSLTYDAQRTVPLSVKEDTITHRNAGIGGNYDKVEQHVTLTLASDSMRAAQGQ